MVQGGDMGTGVVFTIQGGFLLGGSGASSNWVMWFGVGFLFLSTGMCHMAWFATVQTEFVLEAVVLFFCREFTEGLRVLRNGGIDLCFFCNKVAVLGRRRRAWSLWILALVDFIGTIKFTGFG